MINLTHLSDELSKIRFAPPWKSWKKMLSINILEGPVHNLEGPFHILEGNKQAMIN